MPFLASQDIKQLITKEQIFVPIDDQGHVQFPQPAIREEPPADEVELPEPLTDYYSPKLVKQCSYDLRLGPEIYIVGKEAPTTLTEEEPYAVLPPGEFAVLTSYEVLNMPPYVMGFISIRSTYKFQGLVNISGFHVDATFKGRLRFAVQNVGPSDIHLKLKEPTFSIFFAELSSEVPPKDARDQEAELAFAQRLLGIPLHDVQLLGGNNITLASLNKDVEKLRTLVTIYGAAALAALGALIVRLLVH